MNRRRSLGVLAAVGVLASAGGASGALHGRGSTGAVQGEVRSDLAVPAAGARPTSVARTVSARAATSAQSNGLRFDVSLDASLGTAPVNGRVYVIVSHDGSSEPRFQTDVADPVPFWGKNATLQPGAATKLGNGAAVYGFPLEKVKELPPGDYYVQAFMNVYTTFHRSDGSVVALHMPCGDGADVFGGTGNLYSDVVHTTLGPRTELSLNLAHVVPPRQPIPPGGTCQQGNPPDSDWVKHIKIQSQKLTDYWGQPMYLAANVLLPRGYADHPDERYPVIYSQGHFSTNHPLGFRDDLSNDFSAWWASDAAPKVIVVTLRHETPYYDDSYAVNSANLGPYGDAIVDELIPAIDASFRTIPTRSGRALTGGSTGGWESLAQMIFYPQTYSGTFSLCPDPVDLRYHQLVNVYSDANAYWTLHDWQKIPRPSARSVDGNVRWTMDEENHYELAMGDHGRSGVGQWDIWNAVFGPQGADGYPAPAWDKETGTIDHSVTDQWRAYDLNQHLQANWATLAPQLQGRLHIYVGDDDTYYLNDAVELLEQWLVTADPPADAEIQYGHNQPHCWSPYTSQELVQVMADFMASHPD